MKKLLLLCLVMALSYGVQAQVVPLKVYNGTTSILIVHTVVVTHLTICSSSPSASVGTAVMPGAIITIAPLVTGPAAVKYDWSIAKITNLGNTASLAAIHPYYNGCFGPSGSWGTPTLTDYWYPIGSTPYQLLKVY